MDHNKTVGEKHDQGKIKAGVIIDFGLALMAVAEVGTFGIEKYKLRGGWSSVPDGIQRYEDAMWRHLIKSRYERLDDDSGLLHEAHFVWCALARLELKFRQAIIDKKDEKSDIFSGGLK